MKTVVLLLLGVSFGSARAAQIREGSYDAGKRAIVLTVYYGGGCKEHDFSLKTQGCRETMPVQCTVELLENAHGDRCRAWIKKTLEFPLKAAGLDDPYYSDASLSIGGDNDTRVHVKLPKIDPN
jgi:hypothetical protein